MQNIIIIEINEANQRLDRFIRKYCKKITSIKLADIYHAIRKGKILVNNKKQKENYFLQIGDKLEFLKNRDKNIHLQESENTKETRKLNININEIKKQIIFEDKNWIIWDKPAGLVVHPGNKHIDDLTLNDYLQFYVNYKKNSTFIPAFGYRLDRDTSGVIVAAKNYSSLQYLNDLIRRRDTSKKYLAILAGIFPKKKLIEMPIFRGFNKRFGRAQSFVNEELGSPAKTEIKLLQNISDKFLGDISLVEIKLFTGRMHQIRTHASHIGYPILGDIMYGDDKLNKILAQKYKITRQLLHARYYGFWDKDQQINIEATASIPHDFSKLFSEIFKYEQ